MIVGIFVGGKSSRMRGAPKGLLLAPDTQEPLVVRSARLARSLGFVPVLVGAAEPYRAVLPDLTLIADEPVGLGPLAGLSGLLRFAGEDCAIVLACDMPYVSLALLQKLAETESTADVVAARGDTGLWEPLCARYRSPSVQPVLTRALSAGVRSFQRLFGELSVAELELSPEETAQLADWDAPEDVQT